MVLECVNRIYILYPKILLDYISFHPMYNEDKFIKGLPDFKDESLFPPEQTHMILDNIIF